MGRFLYKRAQKISKHVTSLQMVHNIYIKRSRTYVVAAQKTLRPFKQDFLQNFKHGVEKGLKELTTLHKKGVEGENPLKCLKHCIT